MDHFGIGAALQLALRMYVQGARQTGRTTSLIESLKDGDRVVCLDNREAKRLEGLCRERRIKVKCVAVSRHDAESLFHSGTPEGRTIFEHTWIEAFYEMTLRRAAEQIDHLERELSGYGAAHRETLALARQWTER
jgi:hypothetical protein